MKNSYKTSIKVNTYNYTNDIGNSANNELNNPDANLIDLSVCKMCHEINCWWERGC